MSYLERRNITPEIIFEFHGMKIVNDFLTTLIIFKHQILFSIFGLITFLIFFSGFSDRYTRDTDCIIILFSDPILTL